MPKKTSSRAQPPPEPGGRAQAVLDQAFARASKVVATGKTRLERARSLTGRKVGRASGTLLRQLALAKAPFRDTEGQFNEFTRNILEARLGPGRIERSLHRLHVAEERLIRFRAEETRRIARASDLIEVKNSMRRFYGRASSVLEEIDADLALLGQAKSMIRSSPHLDPSDPTVVVVGYPNVGKSSLVGRLSSASPKVAPYPFTTLQVSLGHAAIGPTMKAQFVDTPGLVETGKAPAAPRPPARGGPEQHVVEREARAAVESTSGVVIFLLDPTGSCGWSPEEQRALLQTLRSQHPARRFVVVENKADLVRSSSPYLKISCATGEGIPELLSALEAELGGRPGTRSPPKIVRWE